MPVKKDLKDNVQSDMDLARGAMKEILVNNRVINKDIISQMANGDYALLEEYTLLTKAILDSAKLLTEINAQTPKTLQEIEKVQDEKTKINLNDLMDDDDSDS